MRFHAPRALGQHNPVCMTALVRVFARRTVAAEWSLRELCPASGYFLRSYAMRRVLSAWPELGARVGRDSMLAAETSHNAIIIPAAALVFCVTSFHGRCTFPGGLALDDPITALAALEAVIGLFIEMTFIATFTQRLSGSR